MKHKPSKVWQYYEVTQDGKVKVKKRTCPRCGEGYYLAEHKEKDGSIRYFCGHCHFSEWVKPKAN